MLNNAKTHAEIFAKTTEGIAVLSDFILGVCHTYCGKFGKKSFSLPEYSVDETSPFEDVIFNGMVKEDLLERHILELRFFNFIKTIPQEQRTDYQMSCIIRLRKHDGTTLPILHTSRYIHWDSTGNTWLGLCTFIPMPLNYSKDEQGVINSVMGEVVMEEAYTKNDSRILSRRQTQILSLLAKGDGSKQISEKLNISTVEDTVELTPCDYSLGGVKFTKAKNEAAGKIEITNDTMKYVAGPQTDYFRSPDGSVVNSSSVIFTEVDNTKPFTFTAKVNPQFTETGTYSAGVIYAYENDLHCQKLCFEQDEYSEDRGRVVLFSINYTY